MFTVYLIRSLNFPDKKYVGYTTNFERRLAEHNTGKVKVTKNFGPWKPDVLIQFQSEEKAKAFEKY